MFEDILGPRPKKKNVLDGCDQSPPTDNSKIRGSGKINLIPKGQKTEGPEEAKNVIDPWAIEKDDVGKDDVEEQIEDLLLEEDEEDFDPDFEELTEEEELELLKDLDEIEDDDENETCDNDDCDQCQGC